MEVWIDWSSSCGDYSNNRKRSSSPCGVVSGSNRSPDIGTGTRGAEMEEDDLIFQLRSLKQVSHIRSYIEAFDELNSRAGIEENQALSIFLSGLVDQIRVPVCMFEPRTLDEGYALSKLQELTISVLWCDRKKRYEDEVDYSTKDSIRNPALKTELELDSEMEDETYADEGIDLDVAIDVDRAIADEDLMETMDANSSSYCNTDFEQWECNQSPVQKTEELEPEPAVCEQQLSEWQTDVVEGELNLVMEGTESLNDHHEGKLGKEEVHVAVLKGVEIFMPMGKSMEVKKGRELEQVNELYYSLSLPWLLNWFPRPTVKLKFVARCDDELHEGFVDRSKGFVECGKFSICNDRGQLGTKWENGFTVVGRQLDQRSSELLYLPGLFDGVFSRSDFGGKVFGDNSYPLGYEEWGSHESHEEEKTQPISSTIEECKEWGFDIIEIDAGSLGIPEEILLRYVRLVKTGSLRAKPLLAVKFNKSDIPICGDRAHGSYTVPVQRTYELVKDVNLLIRRAERCIEAGVDVIMIDAEDVCRQADSLGNLKEERVNITELQSYKLSSYQKSTSYLAVENSDAELEFSDSKQLKNSESLPTARPNALVGKLDVTSPISVYYCVSLWMFIWGPKPMVKMKLMAHPSEVIEEDLNSMIFPISKKFKEAGVLFSCQGINGKYVEMDERAATLERTWFDIVDGDINDVSPWKKHFEIVSFSERNGTDLASSERVGTDLARLSAATRKANILQGKSIPILEADSQETVAVGKSSGSSSVMKKTSQLSDIDWLVSIWFPQPTVKMKHEGLVRRFLSQV